MRTPIYLIAILVAAGVAYFLAQSPEQGNGQVAKNLSGTNPGAANPGGAAQRVVSTSSAAGANADPVASQVLVDAGTIVLRVEDMHCEFACYPKVRETLEGFDGVVSVELDEQAEKGTLDNPQVLITYNPGFDLGAARAALAKKGYSRSSVVP